MEENYGKPIVPNESAEERQRRIKKAMEHEQSFGKRQDTDIIKKRMDSDLFKGGNW